MRDLKFRAKVPNNISGSVTDIRNIVCTAGEWFYFDIKWLAENDSDGVWWIDLNTICQYTGLKDKNGKEIYEGDVIETGTGHRLKVEWNEACAMWTLDGLQEFMIKLPDETILPMHSYSQVIGNIYSNPDLLK